MFQLRPAVWQALAGLIVLALGVFVYLLDRPPGSVYLLPDDWMFGDGTRGSFGQLGWYLPTFTHTFAFSLFTSAVLEPWRWSGLAACTGWWLTASLFEIAQGDTWSAVIADAVPEWFSDWPVLDNLADYFSAGRLDPGDLLSIALGSVCAGLVVVLSRRVSSG